LAEKCEECKKDAAVYLAYAGRNLCAKHFIDMFEKRVLRTNREFLLVRRGELIAVGLSGGKDSTVMLHCLSRLAKKMPFQMHAITIDEGIAGYRPNTLAIAKKECRKLGIKHTIVSMKKELGYSMDDVAKKIKAKGSGEYCSYCGVFRRYLLNKTARKIGADKIAIGHNLDDAVQTLLMNLMRNEPERLARFGVLGGVAEDEGFVVRIKPLIRSPEKENALYAILRGIEIDYQECPYAKSAIRQHVRNQLNETEEKYPGAKMKMFNSFLSIQKIVQEASRARAKRTGEHVAKCPSCGEPAPNAKKLCMCCEMIERLGRG